MGELRCARSVCLPFVLSAARHCVRRHAGHVTERPRRGFPFARSAAAEVNYSCVQIGHAILRRHPITGAVQRGNSVTHSVADAAKRITGGRGARSTSLPSFGSTSCPAFALAAAPPAPVPSEFGIIGQAAAAVATRFSFRLSALRG